MKQDSRLRIAIYHGLPAGGARRAAFEQAKRLSQRHELTFYNLGNVTESVLDIRPYAKTSHIVEFKLGKLFQSPLGRLNQAVRIRDLLQLRAKSRQMAALINTGGYDVALIHPCQYAHVPWLLHYLDVPTVYYCHEHNRLVHYEPQPARPYNYRSPWESILDRIDPLHYSYFRLMAWLEQRGLQAANRTLINSCYIQAQIQRLYHLRTHVCYHGVDLQAFPALDLPRSDYVLSVGALMPLKGFDFIIEGLGQLPTSIRPRLILVGYAQWPAEQAYLANLAQQRQVRLEFIARADHQQLVELYNRALATVYTPIGEPFGLVPLESMACGTPVIGIAEGGVKETVLDGVTGYLVPRNRDMLAAAVAKLIANHKLRTEMGQAGRMYVEREWTWDRAIDNLEHHLIEVAQIGTRSQSRNGGSP